MSDPLADRPAGLAQTIKVGRGVRIGEPPDDICVWIGSVKGSYVRLVVDAPDHLRISRINPERDAGDQ